MVNHVGLPRPRFNQKGRQASNGKGRKAGSNKRTAYEVDIDDDSNALIIDPEERKRKKLEHETAAHSGQVPVPEPKMSSKKKKRMDAYIARKLKKEDRKMLIASLAQTQTTNLSLRSSSALGSKQFKTQEEKLDHARSVEEGRRGRAQQIVKRLKGKGHHTDSEYDSNDEDGGSSEDGEDVKVAKDVGLAPAAAPLRSKDTVSSRGAPLYNASGSLGVVHIQPSTSKVTTAPVVAPTQPVASTSQSQLPDDPPSKVASQTVPPPPALIPAAVGSGLKAGVTVTVVKRAKKQKGRMRAMFMKGKGKEVESLNKDSEEEDSSEFDSSDSSMDEDDDGHDGISDAESWHGIEDLDGTRVAFGQDNEGDAESSSSEGDDEAEDSDEDEEKRMEVNSSIRPKRQKGDFKAWAEAQIASAAGLPAPLPSQPDPTVSDAPYVPMLPAGSGFFNKPDPNGITGPLGEVIPEAELPTMPAQRSTHIPFTRSEEIQKQREELPIVKEEDRLMEAIRGNAVVVVCGETGSGKTTQIGQFLLEGGWGDKSSDNPGMIAITQPRRVAALSTSVRVREELCLPPDSAVVAHRIRYSSTSAADTKLVFMTDGVLLRELATDFLLSKYSVVVIDEAHERGVNTDVLIGVLSRVARLREDMWKNGKDGAKPLRLIIMSATLRVSDFAENKTLFPRPPPVLHVTARQHPVTVHFSRRTSPHYMDEAYKKVCRIHARLPAGGILVFCTGQNEIVALVKRLEKKFGAKAIRERKERARLAAQRAKDRELGKSKSEAGENSDEDEDDEEVEVGDDLEVEDIELGDDRKDLAADVDDGLPEEDDDPEGLESSDDEDSRIAGVDMEADTDEPLHILPLYSLLPTEKQMRVFKEPPPNTRLVVIATNVAETSITIPNIRYVVDTGRAKERKYDADSGIQTFEVSWISKAAASQRAGRAGRTGPGHCYRLYSSAVFENYFDQHTKPEILRMPIEGVVLQMKSMNIDSVSNFPFPTPPDRESLRKAEKTLVNLGALEASASISKAGGRITELGKSMALFPLSPRFSKMLVAGQQHGCLPYVVAVVCSLSVGDPFIREANLGDDGDELPDLAEQKALTAAEIRHIRDPEIRAKEEVKLARKSFFQVQAKYAALGKGASDIFKLLSVVGAYEYDGGREIFCQTNFVRPKAMEEIHKLRSQISRIVQSTFPGIDAGFVPKLQPPSDTQLKVIRQLVTSAFIDQVAIRKDLVDKSSSLSYARVPSTRGVPYRAFGIDEDLFIHPSSGTFHNAPAEFVVFQELHRTSKVWMKTLTKINPAWLPVLGKPLCTFSKPLETPTTSVQAAVAAKAGKNGHRAVADADGSTREIFLTPRFGSGVGIELKPVKMVQRLEKGRWIFV
ncbi:P-loop containing nucleoside triphosphate hydrolase protein [Meredithblackwellia eburnea MCA 4105]